jgi:hypothetical protein
MSAVVMDFAVSSEEALRSSALGGLDRGGAHGKRDSGAA